MPAKPPPSNLQEKINNIFLNTKIELPKPEFLPCIGVDGLSKDIGDIAYFTEPKVPSILLEIVIQ